VDGAKAQVTCGSSRFTLQTLPTEEYPALPGASGCQRDGQGPDVFAQAVSQVVNRGGPRGHACRLLTGCPGRDRGIGRSRCSPPTRYRLAIRELEWNPQSPDASAGRPSCRPRVLFGDREGDDRLRRGIVSLAAPGTG